MRANKREVRAFMLAGHLGSLATSCDITIIATHNIAPHMRQKHYLRHAVKIKRASNFYILFVIDRNKAQKAMMPAIPKKASCAKERDHSWEEDD